MWTLPVRQRPDGRALSMFSISHPRQCSASMSCGRGSGGAWATTLRISLGTPRRQAREREPARALGRRRAAPARRAAKTDSSSGKCVKTCVTAPGRRRHSCRDAGERGRSLERACVVEIRRPRRRRDFGHAAEEAVRRPGAKEHVSVAAQDDKGRARAAACPSRLGALRGNVSGRRARAPRRPRSTGRARRPVSRACRWWRRDPSCLRKVAGAFRRRKPVGARANGGFAAGRFLLDRKEPRDHPLDIAVDRRRAAVERDRGDRRGRIGADARAAPRSPPRCRGNCPPCRSPPPGAGVQVAGPRVVAEPRPSLSTSSSGATASVRPSANARETRVVGRDRLDGRLLQHDFREPHPVGIGRSPGRRARAACGDAGPRSVHLF